ncbi:MAG TPA: hypothetical protein VNK95_15180 [Caldilineaceae bacterium]|nr:hypothetical protein [Caldilineaceae bacterium]
MIKPSGDTNYAIRNTSSTWREIKHETWTERIGVVATPLGLIHVSAGLFHTVHKGRSDFTHIRFIWQGRDHMRFYDRYVSTRQAATLARRFAEEIVGEHHADGSRPLP